MQLAVDYNGVAATARLGRMRGAEMAQLFEIKKIVIGPKNLEAVVDLAPNAPLMTSEDLEGTTRVWQVMPELRDHVCLGDKSGNFGEVMGATELAHLLEHVTVELLARTNIAGDITCGQTAQMGEREFKITFPCPDDVLVVGALSSAAWLMQWAFSGGGDPMPDADAIAQGLVALVESLPEVEEPEPEPQIEEISEEEPAEEETVEEDEPESDEAEEDDVDEPSDEEPEADETEVEPVAEVEPEPEPEPEPAEPQISEEEIDAVLAAPVEEFVEEAPVAEEPEAEVEPGPEEEPEQAAEPEVEPEADEAEPEVEPELEEEPEDDPEPEVIEEPEIDEAPEVDEEPEPAADEPEVADEPEPVDDEPAAEPAPATPVSTPRSNWGFDENVPRPHVVR